MHTSWKTILAATIALAMPAWAADSGMVTYVLFVNVSSHPFKVKSMTLGGKPCSGCSDRTIAAGSTVQMKVGTLGKAHLVFTVAAANGSGCRYDITPDAASRWGECGSPPKIDDAFDTHTDYFFHSDGKPTFEVVYAYDAPPAK